MPPSAKPIDDALPSFKLQSTRLLSHKGWPKLEIATYERGGFQVVFCGVPGPLTLVSDNRGLPHTLEHLIFVGSETHPQRGFLDRLATRCISNGTNAYTSEDHTAYTVTTASAKGMLRLLPIFLEHVLHPTIDSHAMATEVFHVDEQECRGVVYCEMKARQNTEADQMDLLLRRLLYGESESCTYSWECGGLTKDIAAITRDDIMGYHRKWYRPELLTVVLCGRLDHQEVLALLAQRLEAKPLANVQPDLIGHALPLHAATSAAGQFPADDESLGSVGLAYAGPCTSNLCEIIALHVLMRYLRGSPAAPLSQKFVECRPAYATDIDYEIKPFHPHTMITLLFSGVPTGKPEEADSGAEDEESCDETLADEAGSQRAPKDALQPGVIREMLAELLNSLLAHNLEHMGHSGLELIRQALGSFMHKTLENLEDDPHEFVYAYCLPSILRARLLGKTDLPIGSDLSLLPSLLESLYAEPVAFWCDLMRKHLLESQSVEVRMHPSRELEAKVAQVDADIFSENRTRIANTDLAAQLNMPTEIAGDSLPLVEQAVESYAPLLVAAFSDDGRDSAVFKSMQLVKVDSPFVTVNICIDLRNFNLPLEELNTIVPLLPLFCQLILESPISLSGIQSDSLFAPSGTAKDLLSYQNVVQILESTFVSHDCSIGFDGDTFSVGYLEHVLVFSLVARPEICSVSQITRTIAEIVSRVGFENERIATVVASLNSLLVELGREPNHVVDSILTHCIHSNTATAIEQPKRRKNSGAFVDFEMEISRFRQEPLLSKISEMIKASKRDAETVKRRLELLRSSILASMGDGTSFLQIAGHPDLVYPSLEQLNEIWLDASSTDAQRSTRRISHDIAHGPWSMAPLPQCFHWPISRIEHDAIVVPLADVASACIMVVVDCPLFPTTRSAEAVVSKESIREFAAALVLCEFLSLTEGPLYSKVRGDGLAYGVSVSLALWAGQLSFHLNDSNNPAAGWQAFAGLLRQIIRPPENKQTEPDVVSEDWIETAKASAIYNRMAAIATAPSLKCTSFRHSLRGLPLPGSKDDGRIDVAILAVAREDLLEVARLHFSRLLDPGMRLLIATLPSSSAKKITRELGQAGFSTAVRQLNSFA